MTEIEQLLRRAAPLSGDPADTFPKRMPRKSAEDPVAKRLSRWRNNAAENSSEAFDQRLAWEGLTRETAPAVLADERMLDARDESWAPTARLIVQSLAEASLAKKGGRYPAPPGVPFAPILSPLVNLAIDELSLVPGVPPLAPGIEAQLGAPLYQRLSDIAHRAAGGAFRNFRDALPSRDGAWPAFEEHMLGGGWLALLERLPVLLRLLATAMSLWAAETAEFLRRLQADREDLIRVFGMGEQRGATVEQISGMLSDPHRGGRNVKIVRFSSGLRVVYKPKSLAIDAAWFGLTEWIRQRTGIALRAPRVLNRADWGWAEFIPHEPCEDAEAVERFYRRAGHLLCLLYATASSDFHHENLLAFGDFPVPIDLETVFNAEPVAVDEPTASTLRFQGSVLRTLMLPNWMELSGQNDAVDISALGSRPDTQPQITRRRWIQPNSDAMEFVAIQEKGKQPRSIPFHADGTSPDAGQFLEKLASGFAEAYDCLMANREALLSPQGPLEAFRTCRTRLVLRPTHIYARIAERALNASCLACGADRSLEFEGLSRHYLASGESHGGRVMFRAEVRAMEQMDIPYFQLQTDSLDLLDGDGNVVERNFIKTPGYENVRQRIAALSSEDRAIQLELIRASFTARDFGGPDQAPVFRALRGVPECDQLSSNTLRETARGIARDILARAIWHGEEVNWIGHDVLPVSGRLAVQPLGSSLYGGLPGMAVFLAAQYVVEGDPEYRRAAVGITRTLQRSFLQSAMDRKTIRTFFLAAGIGGGAGAGSSIYGLLKVGQILHDEETVDTALRLARLLDADAIQTDMKLDVMSGAAGAILSLLPLWKQTGEAELLSKALLCGERLLKKQGPEGAWLTIARHPLAGFSHGAAGIGLALLRLHAAVPDPRFEQAAMTGFAYERTLFSPEACNWEDLRDFITKDRMALASWCHGAYGVALSRIEALKLAARAEWQEALRSDLNLALVRLAGSEIRNNGTVCCGEMGRAEILMEAARYLDRPDLEVLARKSASCVVAGLLPPEERPFVAGFFQGVAGIGYGLLRLSAPEHLPSILSWE